FCEDRERLVEARIGLFHIDAEASEFIVAIALADPEIEPSTRQQVQGRGLLGQQYRVVPRQHQDGGAEPQCRGARAEPGQEIEARRHLPETGEMVLDDKGRVKSERLGLDIVLDPLAKSLAAVGQLRPRGRSPRLRAAEQSKPHPFLLRSTQCQTRRSSRCSTPSPPLGAERAGVRWGIPERLPISPPHPPSASRRAPPSPP